MTSINKDGGFFFSKLDRGLTSQGIKSGSSEMGPGFYRYADKAY